MRAMIYLDANVFVYSAINNGELGERSRVLLRKVAKNEISACTSVLTCDEVVYAIRKKAGAEISAIEGGKLIRFNGLKWFKSDENILLMAQEIIETKNLKPRDAIHAATAILNGCKEIISDDSDFDKVKELKRTKIK